MQVKYVSEKAEKGNIEASVSGSGNIVVDSLTTVDPTISGTVTDVLVNVGDTVKKGQKLFTILNEDLTASTLQALSSVHNAEINLNQARTNLVNAKKGGSETERDRNILKEKIILAEQNLQVARINYQNALVDSNKRYVTSTSDGTINAINIKNGDDLSRLSRNSANQAPIIIGDLKTLKAEIVVNEADIVNVALGQVAKMTLSAFDTQIFSGKVEKIDALGTITQGVVNYTVTVGFDTIDERFRPGMSVSAHILTEEKEDVIVVPNSALKVKKNKTYIQVLNPTTKLPEDRMIEMGIANNTDTEIVSGINVGDDIITQTIDPNAKTKTGTANGFRIPGLGGRG